jgi:glutathione S-transferase
MNNQLTNIQPTSYPCVSAAPFGQLPLLEVDGVTIAQSAAIMRYLAHQHGKRTNWRKL